MAPKPKKTGRYPGPGYNETGPGVPKKKPSTSYSPAPMSAAAKKKAAAAGKATAKKTAPKSLVSKVVGRAKTVAREVRDIPTAVGTVIKATAAGKPKAGTNTSNSKSGMYAKYDLKRQVKEVKDAITSGRKGTGAVLYGKGKTEYRNQPKKK